MKFSIPSKAFHDAISAVSRAVEKRNTIPIISNVMISASAGAVELRATDLDMLISMSFAAEVAADGATTVPAHLLQDIVKKMPGDVTFETKPDSQMAVVSAGRSRFQLQCLPVSDFPDITTGSFSHRFSLPGAEFHELISRVQFAISSEETRYYLNGVFLHVKDDAGEIKLRAVATDGHRLAMVQKSAPAGAEGMPGIIIPRKAVNELIGIAQRAGKEDVQIEISESKFRLTAGSTVMVSKLIDGTFPEYERVIPRESNRFANIDSKTLSQAADRVATVSSERGSAVKLTFADGMLSLAVNNPDSGSATEEIDVDYSADPLEIGFSARYLSDVLAAVGAGQTKISLTDSGSPTIFTNGEDKSFLTVLMPMRV